MTEHSETRDHAVERLQTAREQLDLHSQRHDAAAGSSAELPAFTELQAAREQLAAREAWLAWVDEDDQAR
jgi:hypothetical protein